MNVAKSGPNKMLSARNTAVARLIDAHADEFERLLKQECVERGIVYVKPETKAEREARLLVEKQEKARQAARMAYKKQGLPIPEFLFDDAPEPSDLDEFAPKVPDAPRMTAI